MGSAGSALSGLITVCVIMLICCLGVSGVAEDIRASGKRLRYPGYKKDGSLQFLLYGKKGSIEGVEGKIEEVLIDVFNKNLKDINEVRNYKNLKLYAIREKFGVIMDFWKDKPFTDCFISTSIADFDRVTKIVKSDKEVKLRSKAMDVDGVGFDADYNTRIIHIRSKVKVVIRAAMARNQGGIEKKRESTTPGVKVRDGNSKNKKDKKRK